MAMQEEEEEEDEARRWGAECSVKEGTGKPP